MRPGIIHKREDIERFVFAGRAYFTLRSRKTQARHTFRVTASKDGNVFFVGVLCGGDNERSYRYVGFVDARSRLSLRMSAKSKLPTSDERVKAIEWYLRRLGSEAVEFWHEGRCGCCGRKLTVPESIELGIGPVCDRKKRTPERMQVARAQRQIDNVNKFIKNPLLFKESIEADLTEARLRKSFNKQTLRDEIEAETILEKSRS